VNSLYRNFKTDLGNETYLKQLQSKMIISLTKFKICNTKLPTEQDKYQNVHRYQRYCNLFTVSIIDIPKES